METMYTQGENSTMSVLQDSQCSTNIKHASATVCVKAVEPNWYVGVWVLVGFLTAVWTLITK